MRLHILPMEIEGLVTTTPRLIRQISSDPMSVADMPLKADLHYDVFWNNICFKPNINLYKVLKSIHPKTIISYICDTDVSIAAFMSKAIEIEAHITDRSIILIFEELCTSFRDKFVNEMSYWDIVDEMEYYFEQEMETVLDYLDIKKWFHKNRGEMKDYLFYEGVYDKREDI